MPSTYSSLHYHWVFSTKDRLPLIKKDWRFRMHSYLGGIVKGMQGVPLAIGGVEDHIHLLVGLKTSHRIDYFTRDLKGDSTSWARKECGQRLFSWQQGYSVFSVSPVNLNRVKKYILNQEAHHKRKSFKEEYLELLEASGIEFDERFLW